MSKWFLSFFSQDESYLDAVVRSHDYCLSAPSDWAPILQMALLSAPFFFSSLYVQIIIITHLCVKVDVILM